MAKQQAKAARPVSGGLPLAIDPNTGKSPGASATETTDIDALAPHEGDLVVPRYVAIMAFPIDIKVPFALMSIVGGRFVRLTGSDQAIPSPVYDFLASDPRYSGYFEK